MKNERNRPTLIAIDAADKMNVAVDMRFRLNKIINSLSPGKSQAKAQEVHAFLDPKNGGLKVPKEVLDRMSLELNGIRDLSVETAMIEFVDSVHAIIPKDDLNKILISQNPSQLYEGPSSSDDIPVFRDPEESAAQSFKAARNNLPGTSGLRRVLSRLKGGKNE